MCLGAALGLHAADVPVLVVLLQWLPGCPGAVFCDGSPWFLPGWIVALCIMPHGFSRRGTPCGPCMVLRVSFQRCGFLGCGIPMNLVVLHVCLIHCLCRGFLVTCASCVALHVFDACMLALVFPLWSALPGDLGGPSCAPSIWLAVLLLPTGSVTRLRLGFASAFQKHVYTYMYIYIRVYICISVCMCTSYICIYL